MLKNTLYISIADINIRVHFRKTRWQTRKKLLRKGIERFLKGFILSSKPINVAVSIDFCEKQRMDVLLEPRKKTYFINFYEQLSSEKIKTFYSISVTQFQSIIASVLKRFITNRGIILHGSAVNVNGQAYIFLGPPGIGKSTITKTLTKYPVLGDDSVVILKKNQRYIVCQTPFMEKNKKISRKIREYVLSKVFFLRKKRVFSLTKIGKGYSIIKKIINNSWLEDLPEEQIKLKQTKWIINFVKEFSGFYFLSFKKNQKNLAAAI